MPFPFWKSTKTTEEPKKKQDHHKKQHSKTRDSDPVSSAESDQRPSKSQSSGKHHEKSHVYDPFWEDFQDEEPEREFELTESGVVELDPNRFSASYLADQQKQQRAAQQALTPEQEKAIEEYNMECLKVKHETRDSMEHLKTQYETWKAQFVDRRRDEAESQQQEFVSLQNHVQARIEDLNDRKSQIPENCPADVLAKIKNHERGVFRILDELKSFSAPCLAELATEIKSKTTMISMDEYSKQTGEALADIISINQQIDDWKKKSNSEKRKSCIETYGRLDARRQLLVKIRQHLNTVLIGDSFEFVSHRQDFVAACYEGFVKIFEEMEQNFQLLEVTVKSVQKTVKEDQDSRQQRPPSQGRTMSIDKFFFECDNLKQDINANICSPIAMFKSRPEEKRQKISAAFLTDIYRYQAKYVEELEKLQNAAVDTRGSDPTLVAKKFATEKMLLNIKDQMNDDVASINDIPTVKQGKKGNYRDLLKSKFPAGGIYHEMIKRIRVLPDQVLPSSQPGQQPAQQSSPAPFVKGQARPEGTEISEYVGTTVSFTGDGAGFSADIVKATDTAGDSWVGLAGNLLGLLVNGYEFLTNMMNRNKENPDSVTNADKAKTDRNITAASSTISTAQKLTDTIISTLELADKLGDFEKHVPIVGAIFTGISAVLNGIRTIQKLWAAGSARSAMSEAKSGLEDRLIRSRDKGVDRAAEEQAQQDRLERLEKERADRMAAQDKLAAAQERGDANAQLGYVTALQDSYQERKSMEEVQAQRAQAQPASSKLPQLETVTRSTGILWAKKEYEGVSAKTAVAQSERFRTGDAAANRQEFSNSNIYVEKLKLKQARTEELKKSPESRNMDEVRRLTTEIDRLRMTQDLQRLGVVDEAKRKQTKELRKGTEGMVMIAADVAAAIAKLFPGVGDLVGAGISIAKSLWENGRKAADWIRNTTASYQQKLQAKTEQRNSLAGMVMERLAMLADHPEYDLDILIGNSPAPSPPTEEGPQTMQEGIEAIYDAQSKEYVFKEVYKQYDSLKQDLEKGMGVDPRVLGKNARDRQTVANRLALAFSQGG